MSSFEGTEANGEIPRSTTLAEFDRLARFLKTPSGITAPSPPKHGVLDESGERTVNDWNPDEDNRSERDTTASDDGIDVSASGSLPSETDITAKSETRDQMSDFSVSDILWILRRNTITDGREQTVQLPLQESTLDTQRKQKTTIENRLGGSVRKAGLREVALLVGLQHTDDIVGVPE